MYDLISLRQLCIELTSCCNCSCIHCGTSASPDKSEFLEMDLLRKTLLGSLDSPLKQVILLGGEPLLYPQHLEILEFISQLNMESGLITNGWFLDELKCKQLIEKNLTFCGISIDADSPEIHDMIRGKKGIFDKAVKAAEISSRLKLETTVITSLSKHNLHHYQKLLPWIKKNELTWQIQTVTPNGCRFQTDNMLIPEDYAEIAMFIQNAKRNYPWISVAHDIGYFCPETQGISESENFRGCIGGIFSAGIRSNGDIVPCLSLPEEYKYGNISSDSLTEVFYSKDFFPRNREINSDIQGECSKCENFLDCLGGCPDLCLAGTGNIYDNIYCIKKIKKREAISRIL